MTVQADATFLEMDLNSTFLLAPVTEHLFDKQPIYLKTVSYCEDKAAEWQRQMKVGWLIFFYTEIYTFQNKSIT